MTSIVAFKCIFNNYRCCQRMFKKLRLMSSKTYQLICLMSTQDAGVNNSRALESLLLTINFTNNNAKFKRNRIEIDPTVTTKYYTQNIFSSSSDTSLLSIWIWMCDIAVNVVSSSHVFQLDAFLFWKFCRSVLFSNLIKVYINSISISEPLYWLRFQYISACACARNGVHSLMLRYR